MIVEYLNPPDLPRSPVFSQAVVVTQPSRTIYVGGQNGVGADEPGDISDQTTRALTNVGVALAVGGGQLADVISWTIAILAGQDLRAAFGAVQRALAGRTDPPIVSILYVAGLAVPKALVAISAIAVLP